MESTAKNKYRKIKREYHKVQEKNEWDMWMAHAKIV